MSEERPQWITNMSAPARTEVVSEQVAADGGLVIFSTPHACLAAGLYDIGNTHPGNHRAMNSICDKKWNLAGGTEAFFRDLAAIGITPAGIEARAASLRGSLIGWHAYFEHNGMAELKSGHQGAGFCADLELTLAIRSHCVGGLFLARRSPDYSAGALFHETFCVCDRRFRAPTLKEKPWARYVRAFEASADRRRP